MKVQIVNFVTHDGIDYLPGQYLTCSDSEGQRLVQSKVAIRVQEKIVISPAPVESRQVEEEVAEPVIVEKRKQQKVEPPKPKRKTR